MDATSDNKQINIQFENPLYAGGTVFGEIAFTTGVSGFQETPTDPPTGRDRGADLRLWAATASTRTTMPPTAAILSGYVVRSHRAAFPTTR